MEKKSILADILKREKEDRILQNEKKKAVQQAISASSSPAPAKKDEISSWEKKFNAALIEASNDIRFYFLKDDHLSGFKNLYKETNAQLDKYGITAYKFLDYARESFERFKNMKKQMPLEAMDKKSYQYTIESLNSLLKKLTEKFKT